MWIGEVLQQELDKAQNLEPWKNADMNTYTAQSPICVKTVCNSVLMHMIVIVDW